jgi:hypothetical protein
MKFDTNTDRVTLLAKQALRGNFTRKIISSNRSLKGAKLASFFFSLSPSLRAQKFGRKCVF